MYNKHNKTIIKTSKQDRVYIVKYIAKNFNKLILIFIVHTSHSEIVFFVTALNISLHIQTHKYNFMIDFLDVDITSLNEKIKIYRL